jgi:prepilin-type N-terminal cleavage/methylation domain-containing protein
MSTRRAFTLIELLVVIGIIALLMSILLPTLAGARRTARAAVGVANLRSLSQVMFLYCHDYQEEFLTPFRNDWPKDSGRAWTDVVDQNEPDLVWSFYVPSDPKLHTEGFAFYWYSFLQRYYGSPRFSKEMLSPADAALTAMASTIGTRQEALEGWVLWPSSFLYSPTMWCSTERYAGVPRADMTRDLLAAQSIANVASPAGKVLLWERADFRQARRNEVAFPPAFNNPRSRINVATCDGSVSEVAIRDLVTRAADDEQYLPSDTAFVPDGPPVAKPYSVPAGSSVSPDTWPTGGEAGTDLEYPLFFWATRNGVHGRDLAR